MTGESGRVSLRQGGSPNATTEQDVDRMTSEEPAMNIRRMQLDVDKAITRPDLLELAAAIDDVAGVEALNITVSEIDLETVGLEVTVEGESIDATQLIRQIEKTGAAVHSIDEIVVGNRIIERVPRTR
ncbi:DUF211 domain-containing protein [Mycobacterium malmoense]|uniref:DUF211 domain-containing protein n=1 Tax=Mycobacterium malmoense TaxID=1780 RepID=UPI00210DF2F1|nr:DUF211 domain-containing protein [Mycobacterium malmoense]